MLEHFKFAEFKFTLKAEEDINMPVYKGSVFRGGFGYAFKKVVCIQRAKKDCSECMLYKRCVYSYIFETPLPDDAEVLKLYKTIPHPFVLEPPLTSDKIVKQGENTACNLILIGKAIDYLPYFIFTFNELGENGIGKYRRKFVLVTVENRKIDGEYQTVYDYKDETIKGGFDVRDASQLNHINNLGGKEIKFEFITPCRVRFGGKITDKIEFHVLTRSLLRRISSLSYFHCDKEYECDFKSLIEEAKNVETIENDLHWHDWERFSTRQKQKMSLGGVLGRVKFNGNLKPFMPLVKLGEYVHVGKGTSFGLGKYRIISNNDETGGRLG